jgi:predicted enzyme related to lactoylglutathione lyase
MPERDGYIPGVPCWVDASEPDPAAAVDFYGGLFDWEFEDVMPSSLEGKYFIARCEVKGSSIFDTSGSLHSGDVAAVRSIPKAAPPRAMWNTYLWVNSADEAAANVRDAGGGVVTEPGYGDYLERYHPDLRKQMAEAGAPEGFEDVVATLNPIADDQPGTPAHWSVTFAVDDPDATAAKATELGGKVTVPPFDAPGSG